MEYCCNEEKTKFYAWNTDIMKKRRQNDAYWFLLLVKRDSWIQYNCAFDD